MWCVIFMISNSGHDNTVLPGRCIVTFVCLRRSHQTGDEDKGYKDEDEADEMILGRF